MLRILFLLILFGCGSSSSYEDRRCPKCPQQPVNPGQPVPPVTGQCTQATFKQLQPILTAKCVSCHPGYDQYDAASSRIDGFINRVNLPQTDPRYMPKGGTLTPGEQQLFQRFKTDGLLRDCPQGGQTPPVNYSLPEIESLILNDLNQNPFTRDDFRYLVTQRSLSSSVAKQATDKTLNSLSLEAQLRNAAEISPGIFRINLREFGLDANDWRVVEANDSISFESFTPNGQLIKQITRTRLPWMHVGNFAFISQRGDIYYALLDLPNNLQQFFALNIISVNQVDQINNLETQYMGFNGSPISINKNRILQRNVTPFGFLWTTYDVFNVQQDGKNFFSNPLPPEVNSGNTFLSDASEMIFSLPNGLIGFILFAGNERVDFAPTDLVNDIESAAIGLDPQIDNALDCHRCHFEGIINADDQIRAAVVGNPSFPLRDQQLVQLLYTENEAQLINQDNGTVGQAYQELGITEAVDPVSQATDSLRADYNLDRLAALAFLSADQMRLCIQSSAVLQSSIGQLLTGGTVTFEQIQVSLNDIKRDCGLGREFF